MVLTEHKIISFLRSNRYKITPQRKAILRLIYNSKDHLTPIQIMQKINSTTDNISLVTIYRTLDLLTKHSLLCKVHIGGTCSNYVIRKPVEHHHHIICTNCGKVKSFSNCKIEELEQSLNRKTGYKITEHLMELYGICPQCQLEKQRP